MGKLLAGAGLILISLFMLLGFFNLQQPLSPAVAAVTLLLTVALPAIGGARLAYLHFRERGVPAQRREALRLQTYQSEILKLAAKKGGKVAIVEVTAETGIDARSAEDALKGLLEQGIAEIEVTDSGLLVYSFGDVRSLPEKDSSKRILDA
ncbi:MAG TPA: hypothetical protein VJL31_00500 [Gemmatimonadales bacterium]|nr:hypothetical protein [Gemmatimonadales bacterium]